MKICVISTSVFPCPPVGYSGLEMIAWQSAKGLVERGHEVSLIAPEGSHLSGGEIISTGPPGQWGEQQSFETYKERLPEFDVIIDHTWQKWSYLPKAEGKVKAPILGVLHAPVDTMYRTLPPNVENPCFVTISRDQAIHFEGIHSREAKVCYNGVDISFYKQLNIPRSDRFLFLARFSTIKGPDIAIEACKKAGVGLDLVGDTSITNEPDFLEHCKRMCDGKQIRLHGPATRGECVWWFSQALCMLHPNQRFREPFGLAPIEAMSCGCPVIAWRYGALKETISHKGCLVSSVDQMVEKILAFKDMPNDQMVRQGVIRNAEKFSVARMVDRYDMLCQEAVKTGGW